MTNPFLSETEIPPGGWRFRQVQTNWELPDPIAHPLDEATDLIIAHRRQNPGVVEQFGLSLEFWKVKAELIEFNRARLGIPPDNVPKVSPAQHIGAAAVAGHAGKTAVGLKIMRQWLGYGLLPVHPIIAEKRAAICATCPQNQVGDLWQRLDALAGRQLHMLIEIKNDMKLRTAQDDKLKTCLACDCHLPLKVHAPLDHIYGQTTPEIKAQLDPRCWIMRKEEDL